MSDSHGPSGPIRLLLRVLLNILLVWAIATFLPEFLRVSGGFVAFFVIGLLLTLLNIIVRPLLKLLTLPLRLFATLLSLIIVNGVFTWLIYWLVEQLHSLSVSMQPEGIVGWIVVAILFGMGNWLIKLVLS